MKIQKIEEDKFVCTKPDINIVTFDNIFKSVVIHVLNIIYNIYGNLDILKTLNSDVKRLFINTLLEQIYERMMHESGENNILYINTQFMIDRSEIWEYIDKYKFEKFIINSCRSISHHVPIPIYIEYGMVNLLENCGETEETIANIENTLKTFKQTTTSLKTLKRYSKTNGLLQFIDKYHPDNNTKNSIFFYKYFKGATQ